jgi:lysophospholipase L1-like esterase
VSPARALLLSPLLVAQALYARLVTPRLEEPPGARRGSVGAGPGVSLLVLGDSSAAGVGAPHQDVALAHPLAARLAKLTGRRVDWQLLAESGLNTLELLDYWQRAGRPAAEIVVIVSGVNDVVDRLDPPAVTAARQALSDQLLSTGRARHLVFTPLPPMHAFSALAEPLRSYAGNRAREHDGALRAWQGSRAGTSLLSFEFPLAAAMLAGDGFHPGPAAYDAWALALARHLASHVATLP